MFKQTSRGARVLAPQKVFMNQNPVDTDVDNWLAAVFSMMLPGLGQMLKRRIIPGIVWSVVVGGGYLVNGWLGMGVHVLCILEAAFLGQVLETFSAGSALRKGFMLTGLSALIVYTCLRTALF